MLALFAWPNRLFSSEKIVKGEGRDKRKRSFQYLAMPSRILSYEKIVKRESSDKPKTQFSVFGYAGPTPVF
ncbi:hypothetical protein [Barnesiella sp. ET7]|uniref:hypothetical protein n=1 Tax=Barnesiella sp. ET7 TaxID=2972460 RepID=UPI0021AD01A2|nr:hypothetical protein [Barnesiella sp. ET7]